MKKILPVFLLIVLGCNMASAYESGNLRMWAESPVKLGDIIKVVAVFENRGNSPITVKFRGTVYLNNQAVQSLGSEGINVAPRETAELPTYFRPKEAGIYTIRGRAYYSGRTTDMKEITIGVELPAESYPEIGTTIPLETEVGILLVLVFSLAVAVFFSKHSKKG